MFRVFISASSLEKICINEMSKDFKDQSPWFILLTKQNVLYLDKDIYKEWEYGDPLFVFSESYEIKFAPSKIDYNSTIADAPESVLNEPQGAFLLDVDSTTANSIQEKFGVVCHSTSDLNNCILNAPDCKYTLLQGEFEHSWRELFNDGTKIPSNSLIIVDRYIFGYESKLRSNYYDGVENIKQIMKSVLPANLECEYHVLILFDSSSSKDHNYSLEKVGQQLDDFKNNVLKRPYPVIIELFSVTQKCANYDDTHNRKIISNYFIGSAEHLMKAFRKDGAAICSQDIRIEYSYSHGLKDRSDSATKYMNNLLGKISEMYKNGIREVTSKGINAGEYTVLVQNNSSLSINEISNRLIQ